jgi:hypothetical protein
VPPPHSTTVRLVAGIRHGAVIKLAALYSGRACIWLGALGKHCTL